MTLTLNSPSSEGSWIDQKDAFNALSSLPPAQPAPEIYWGYTSERPLANIEIVPRLRDIQKQVGGSYAIDRAIEIIEAVASARTERKTGKWLDGHRAGYGESLYWYIYCSECLYERGDDDHDKDTPFCPNCGCQMERSTDE